MQGGDGEVGVAPDVKAMRAGRSKEGRARYMRVFVLGTEDERCRT